MSFTWLHVSISKRHFRASGIRLVQKISLELSSYNCTRFLLSTLYHWLEDIPLRSKNVAKIKDVTSASCVDGHLFVLLYNTTGLQTQQKHFLVVSCYVTTSFNDDFINCRSHCAENAAKGQSQKTTNAANTSKLYQ